MANSLRSWVSVGSLRAALGVVALASAVAVGCSGDLGGENAGRSSAASVVCAAGPTVSGNDVSEFQGTIDWNAVKGSGRHFAIARISDGSYRDKTFDANWPAMKAAGLIRGAYQYFEPGEDPTMQADIVIGKVGKLGDGDLPVTADVEASGGQSAATIIANLKTWMAKVEAGTGKKPMVYTGKYFWQDSVAGTADFVSSDLWIAAYGPTCPNLPDGSWTNWKFFQFTDKDSVPGISGGVDGDKFNGTLADLTALAGGTVAPGGGDWGAKFVAQSWPFATTAMPMTAGATVDAWIEFQNIGSKPWDGNTKLALTEARDRVSPFHDASWPAPNRLAVVAGTVPPGGNYKFTFKWHAPSAPGSFDEHYGLVQEGVHWFSDPGQLGPADAAIEAKIDVVAAKYAAQFVSQSFPPSDKILAMKVGDKVDGFIELKNVGTDPWKSGVTKLTPTPRDKPSPLGSPSWLSPTRISTPTADVAPGGTFKFPVTLTAQTAGDFVQTFGMLEEAVTWFSDSPAGGGPADDFLKVHVVVTKSGVGPGGDGGTGGDGGLLPDGGTPGNDLAPTDDKGGCGCRVVDRDHTGDGAPRPVWIAGAALALLSFRRRSTRSRD